MVTVTVVAMLEMAGPEAEVLEEGDEVGVVPVPVLKGFEVRPRYPGK